MSEAVPPVVDAAADDAAPAVVRALVLAMLETLVAFDTRPLVDALETLEDAVPPEVLDEFVGGSVLRAQPETRPHAVIAAAVARRTFMLQGLHSKAPMS
jgi:uncharacterized membrane protein